MRVRIVGFRGQRTEALQGQSRVVQEEFSQMPATVGRAIQNLSTEWTRYVGEVDQANGISQKAAEAIGYLAEHLDDLAGMLFSVGKAALAYKAIQLAQEFLAVRSAATAAAAGVVASGGVRWSTMTARPRRLAWMPSPTPSTIYG